MWFYGNLYEGIVIAPNQLSNTIEKLEIWNGYFTVTNPIFYFVPLTHLAVIAVWILAFRKLDRHVVRDIRRAAILLTIAEAVTVYIVVELNLELFFGSKFNQEAITKVRLWNIFNLLRVLLVGIALKFVFNSYTEQIQKEIAKAD